MNPTPSILLYTDDPARGGVAQYNHSILLALAARGYRVTCVQSASTSPLVAGQRAAGVVHVELPYDTAAEFGRTLTDMDGPTAIFEETRPDFIVFSDCCPLSNLGARQAAIALKIPFAIIVGFVAPYLARQFAPCLRVLGQHYARAERVIAVSEENLAQLRTHFGLARDAGEVIRYGRPDTFFTPPDLAVRASLRAELGLADDVVLSLTTARLTKIKGYFHQLAALHALAQRGAASNLHCVWLGEGEQRPLIENQLRKLGLQKKVTLLGHRWDVARWYDAADLFVLPSEHEGMPLAIMEAMAKGLPVVASAVSGIPEEMGTTGKLLPDPKVDAPATVRELASTLHAWSASADLRTRLGTAAHVRASELFRESRMIEQTLALLPALSSAPAASSDQLASA